MIKAFHKEITDNQETNIILSSQKKALKLFREAAVRVPAYGKFLKSHKVNPNGIRTFKDLQNIPYTDKKNYIDLYPLHERVWDADVSQFIMMNSSSGTTGLPYYWPSGEKHFEYASHVHDYLFTTNFQIKEKKTLLIICFGMGTWVAGIYTLLSSYLLHTKKYPLTIITPGFDKKETLRILHAVRGEYEQVIIAGIPTFVKDLLEEWKKENKRKMYPIRILLSGEGFSESWRSYVLSLVGQKHKTDCISILGSAEGSVMGFETKLSIHLRSFVSDNPTFCAEIFGKERVPSLTQFDPRSRFFEEHNGELLLTADLGVPLIRYNMHDIGSVKTYSEMRNLFGRKNNRLFDKQLQLPFISVFGRGKFSATIYAANIYSENVREVLIHEKVNSFVTGRFIIETVFEKNQNHSLHFHVELMEGIGQSEKIKTLLRDIFVSEVRKRNTEYNRILLEYGERAHPVVRLWEYGHPEKFPKKQKKTS